MDTCWRRRRPAGVARARASLSAPSRTRLWCAFVCAREHAVCATAHIAMSAMDSATCIAVRQAFQACKVVYRHIRESLCYNDRAAGIERCRSCLRLWLNLRTTWSL